LGAQALYPLRIAYRLADFSLGSVPELVDGSSELG
jgi:hypothetical protein